MKYKVMLTISLVALMVLNFGLLYVYALGGGMAEYDYKEKEILINDIKNNKIVLSNDEFLELFSLSYKSTNEVGGLVKFLVGVMAMSVIVLTCVIIIQLYVFAGINKIPTLKRKTKNQPPNMDLDSLSGGLDAVIATSCRDNVFECGS